MLSFTIPGPPRTKKNSGRIVPRGRRSIILPSAAYEEWDTNYAQIALAGVRMRGQHSPLKCLVNCRAIFYREIASGDAVGFYQALADSLQKGRIVLDDKQIVQWDGSRLSKDPANPRIEVTLTPIEGELFL